MGVSAAIIVWAIIEAICGKNAGPLPPLGKSSYATVRSGERQGF